MAKVLFSSLVDGVRGRVGGVVFSANGAGAHVKRFAQPLRRRTTPQVDVRTPFATFGGLWADLTITQRNNWNTYATDPAQELINSLGQPYYLNGWQWFVSCNSNLRLAGRAYISDAPVLPIPDPIDVSNLVVTSPGDSGNSIDVNMGQVVDQDLVFSMTWTRGMSNTNPNIRNFKVVLGVQNGDIAATIDLGDLRPIFGNTTAGALMVCYAYAQSSEGRCAQPYPASVLVA